MNSTQRHCLWRTTAAFAVVAAFTLLSTTCGVLSSPSRTVAHVVAFELTDEFQTQKRDALRRAGWIEGENLELELRLNADATGMEEWLPALEADTVHGRPVVLITGSTAHALALKRATSTIPVVVSIGDPVAIGLVASFARPGANITGVSTNPFSQFGKRIEILKEMLPNVRRLGVLYVDPSNPNLPAQIDGFGAAARQLGMDMLPIQARHADDFNSAFETLDRAHVDALYVVQDAVTYANEAELAALATRHGVAMLCARSDWVQRGCLMSYGSNSAALTGLQINYVDRILRGARPGDLPIQLPTVFDLSVNVKTLQTLGFTIDSSGLPLVTEWIE